MTTLLIAVFAFGGGFVCGKWPGKVTAAAGVAMAAAAALWEQIAALIGLGG